MAMPPHDKTPNMKLVMNPEGKVHDWTELEDEQQLPEIMQHVSGFHIGGNFRKEMDFQHGNAILPQKEI